MKNRLHFIAAAYLALATMGAFIFLSLDSLCFDKLAGKSPAQGVFLTPVDRLIDSLAVGAAKDNSFFPLRHCLPRMVMPPSLLSAGSGILCAAVKSITKTAAHNIKSAILLKLRI